MSGRRGVASRGQDQRTLVGRVRKWERKPVPAEGSKTRAQLLLHKWVPTGAIGEDDQVCAATPATADERSTEKTMPLHPTWQVLTLSQRALPTCEGAQRKQADTLKRKTSQGAMELLGEEEEGGRATPLADTPAS